jgi:hypothetical protein
LYAFCFRIQHRSVNLTWDTKKASWNGAVGTGCVTKKSWFGEYVMGCNEVYFAESPAFRRNIHRPSLGSKNKPRKEPQTVRKVRIGSLEVGSVTWRSLRIMLRYNAQDNTLGHRRDDLKFVDHCSIPGSGKIFYQYSVWTGCQTHRTPCMPLLSEGKATGT